MSAIPVPQPAEVPVLQWHGCYDEGWRGLIVPAAFAHPAKFARGLIQRIVEHGLAEGWWKAGDVVGDPFGGVALGGIVCGYHGLNWVGVELEQKFVGLGNENLNKHGPKWMALGEASRVVLLQGDSRRFAEVVGDHLGAVISPPPYAQSIESRGDGIDWDKTCDVHRGSRTAGRGSIADGYGAAEGQIGALKPGDLSAVISSPPYADTRMDGGGLNLTNEHQGGAFGSYDHGATDKWRTQRDQKNIGNLSAGEIGAVLTSPPYAETLNHGGGPDTERDLSKRAGGSLRAIKTGYGGTNGQIGHLPAGAVDAVVTSPPWEDQESAMNAMKFRDPSAFALAMTKRDGKSGRNGTTQKSRAAQFDRATQTTYGESDGQIGNVTGETYWQAMLLVYRSMHQALRPGGYACVVVKDYVKDRHRVRLCDQTLQLLEHVGFTPVCRFHAMLVKERRSAGLFGEHVEKKERKSFFRRLAEKKGSPRIDYEEVLVVRK